VLNTIRLTADICKQTAEIIHESRRVAVRRQLEREICKAVSKEIHVKQFEETENAVEDAVAPMFNRQIQSAAENLSRMAIRSAELSTKGDGDTAEGLADSIFNPPDWDEELVNRALPPLAIASGEAAMAQLVLLGIDPADTDKATTATEWLATQDDIPISAVQFQTPSGIVPMRIATEWPEWMRRDIKANLKESFSQPYWPKVNETTKGDITGFLRRGLLDGQSIETMARNMQSSLHEEGIYARRRARAIARTESGNALNGARVSSMDQLQAEVGPEVVLKKEWLSVLGNTTRAPHARLDGVLEDDNGFWPLGGVRVPWPSHIALPVGERVNCQCTVVTSFGG